MKKIGVKTGFGYFTDKNGHIISKAILPIGEHNCKIDFDYTEVATKEALDQIELYQDPAEIEWTANEQKIIARIRKTAIDALIAEGKLPAGYE